MESKRSLFSKLAMVAAAGLFAGTAVSCHSDDAEEQESSCGADGKCGAEGECAAKDGGEAESSDG